MKKTKDNRIVVVQFIATVMIVILHSGNYSGLGFGEFEEYQILVSFEKFIFHICQIAAPSFFFFSGFNVPIL